MNVLFLDKVHDVVRQELEASGYACEMWNGKTRLTDIAGSYHGFIVRSGVQIDKPLLDAAVNLRFIGRQGAGLENIDVRYAQKKGVNVFNSPEGNRDAVGEHALGMLLSLMNHLPRADRQVREGLWIREENRGAEINEKTIGIIGYGNMGSAFAGKLSGFNCRILAYDKYKSGFGNQNVTEAGYEDIFRETDILSLHVPLTDETSGLVDRAYLSAFHKPIWLINTARGPIVNTADLLHALDEKRLKGAALDVLEYEEHSFKGLRYDDQPETFKKLMENNKVILSPHIAGWTIESKYKTGKVLADKILKLKG
ncbi:MAG: NAD(P)-dependent oxidoreductase [Bacteroidales bacterium]